MRNLGTTLVGEDKDAGEGKGTGEEGHPPALVPPTLCTEFLLVESSFWVKNEKKLDFTSAKGTLALPLCSCPSYPLQGDKALTPWPKSCPLPKSTPTHLCLSQECCALGPALSKDTQPVRHLPGVS